MPNDRDTTGHSARITTTPQLPDADVRALVAELAKGYDKHAPQGRPSLQLQVDRFLFDGRTGPLGNGRGPGLRRGLWRQGPRGPRGAQRGRLDRAHLVGLRQPGLGAGPPAGPADRRSGSPLPRVWSGGPRSTRPRSRPVCSSRPTTSASTSSSPTQTGWSVGPTSPSSSWAGDRPGRRTHFLLRPSPRARSAPCSMPSPMCRAWPSCASVNGAPRSDRTWRNSSSGPAPAIGAGLAALRSTLDAYVSVNLVREPARNVGQRPTEVFRGSIFDSALEVRVQAALADLDRVVQYAIGPPSPTSPWPATSPTNS